MVRQLKEAYEGMMYAEENRPRNHNHEEVVDLVSDEHDNDNESKAQEEDEFSDVEMSEVELSGYFSTTDNQRAGPSSTTQLQQYRAPIENISRIRTIPATAPNQAPFQPWQSDYQQELRTRDATGARPKSKAKVSKPARKTSGGSEQSRRSSGGFKNKSSWANKNRNGSKGKWGGTKSHRPAGEFAGIGMMPT